jgi:chloramphenicol O-acetyltransferase type A
MPEREMYMAFHRVDYLNLDRKEFYEFFDGTVVNVTVELDITDFLWRVKGQGIRFYPALLHCILQVVNGCEDYRYGHDEKQNLGIWDVIHPMYTVPRKNDPSFFSMAITEYQEDFDAFYQAFLLDSARASDSGKLKANETRLDIMGITAAPGLHFSSLSFGGPGDKPPDLAPFVIIGGYREKDGRTILPVTGEFLHAVNDGYHITQFFDLLREKLESFSAPSDRG